MSVTLALTCPSLLKALTSSKRDTSLPRGLLIAKYGMSQIFIHAISQLEVEGDKGVLHLCLFLFFFVLSKPYSSWLQIFRLFHVVHILLSPHLVFSRCCQEDGPHQHYSLQSFPSQGSHCFPTYPRFKRHTSDHTRAYAHMLAYALKTAEPPSLMRKCTQMKAPASSLVEN